MGTSAVTYTDLNEEVPQVFLELWDVLVEAEQTLNEHFDLCTVHTRHSNHSSIYHSDNINPLIIMYLFCKPFRN